MRLRAVERGDRIFERYTALAILVTPPWIAGIHGVRTGVYLFWNTLEAALWAGGIGMAAYLVGPSVVDEANDLGLVTTIGVVALIVFAVGGELLRRRRRRSNARCYNPVPANEIGLNGTSGVPTSSWIWLWGLSGIDAWVARVRVAVDERRDLAASRLRPALSSSGWCHSSKKLPSV